MSSITKTTRPADREYQEAAISTFMGILRQRAENRPADLQAAGAALTAALAGHADPELVDRAIDAAGAIDSRLLNERFRQMIGQGDYAAALFAGQVSSIEALLHAAIGSTTEVSPAQQTAKATLEHARQRLNDAKATVEAARAELAAAVDAGDLDEVLRLRTEVEVTGPGRIDAAELQLLDARIAQCRAKSEAAASRVADTAGPLAKAATALQKATEVYERAKEEHDRAAKIAALAQADVDALTVEAEHLRLDRTRMAAGHQAARRDRTRKLAGLDEPAPAEPPVETINLVTSPPVTIAH